MRIEPRAVSLRPIDSYGRKLRIVLVDGRSVGERLVAALGGSIANLMIIPSL